MHILIADILKSSTCIGEIVYGVLEKSCTGIDKIVYRYWEKANWFPWYMISSIPVNDFAKKGNLVQWLKLL